MNYVYRYTDLADNVIKYVGISCRESENGMMKRFREHCRNDLWCSGKNWKIEYIEVPTKGDAHALEGHFIALFGTKEWYNVAKTDFGLISFLNIDFKWQILVDNVYADPKLYSPEEKTIIRLDETNFAFEVAKQLADARECLKVINHFLDAEDYSKFPRKKLLEDKEYFERRQEAFINFQLSKKVYIV